MHPFPCLVQVLITILSLVSLSSTLPLPSINAITPGRSSDLTASPLIVARDFPSPKHPLRILCIGDSITVGLGDGHPLFRNETNGYRLDLYNLLQADGIASEFMGTQSSGTNNPQPRMEGYGGQVINTILHNIQQNEIIRQQPDVVLLHAGTNDFYFENVIDPTTRFANAPSRLATLIDYVNANSPHTVILVAELIQNSFNQRQANYFNSQIPIIVAERYLKGYKIRAVDMSMIGVSELSDWVHPDAEGYADMAHRWYAAIYDIPHHW